MRRALPFFLLGFIGGSALSVRAVESLVEQPLATHMGRPGATMFTELPAAQTGFVTENRYADPKMWGELYHEFEIGSLGTGVAIGDYDGDGRPDIFVVSKTESCRLFRNLGDFKFQDVTESAGVADRGTDAQIWKQGATFVDINNDGLLDLYVCRFNAPNRLYVNQGNGTFKEMAHAYGLDVKDASVMASFCDYDRDGWLDVYIVTNLLDSARRPSGQRDYLFRNNHDGTFTDVTERAGISGDGQGHSATWWDFDNDGWPDLYVANDFHAPDRLYRNNHDGTFTDVINQAVPHMPFSAMGSDLGDINNDGRLDFVVGEMAATTHEKDQRGMVATRSQAKEPEDRSAMAPQLYRNAVYLNTGTERCLEAAFLLGIAATDWTWSLRFEDLDNDGRLDLFATNGMHREPSNIDLLNRQMRTESAAERIKIMRDSPVLAESNLAFRNRGDLQFENVSRAWGLDQKGVSFGAAFGDLDGDGDLDLVYTNYQAGATLLRNDCDTGHRVVVALRGTVSNRFGIGSTVRIETQSGAQVRQLWLARGYLSSSEPVAHFGLGDNTTIKRLVVTWPTGHEQVYENLAADRRFTITEAQADRAADVVNKALQPQFEEVGAQLGLAVDQVEDVVDETAAQRLLPFRLNRRGPAVAVGDIDGDGRDDVLIGGTTRAAPRVLLGAGTQSFTSVDMSALMKPNGVNDGPLLLLDIDGSGKNALLRTKAGNSLPAGAPEYQPRLYVHDQNGAFREAASDALPTLSISAGAAVAADFDHDGRLDVFIGARLLPGDYPATPRSALLANRGGKFEDVTDSLAPALREVGLVTAALWTDVDNDGWLDLLVACDWGLVKCFHNQKGRGFEDWTERLGFSRAGTGWWTSIAAADFNGDGRMDYAVGNAGLNTPYRADPEHPALLFYGDFRGEGEQPQIVEAYWEGDRLYPWRGRKELGAVVPAMLRRFPQNDAYARATLEEIIGPEKLKTAQRFAATELRSGVFLSQPDGSYRFEPLPRIAQIAPIQGLVAADFDGDGKTDLYAAQNSYAPVPAIGRFDGGLSQLLRGDGHGHFIPATSGETGLIVPGDAKSVALIDLDADGWPDALVTRNNDTALVFRNRRVPGSHSLAVRLKSSGGNPSAIGARVTAVYADGSTQAQEIEAGSGFASQSSAECFFGRREANPIREIRVRWPNGETREYPPPSAENSTLTLEPRL